jgi:hypothetical protein
MTEPTTTMYVCMAPGCRARGHDASLAHVHDYTDATRAYLEAEAAAVAKRKIPQTLVHCGRAGCLASPYPQSVQQHVHEFASTKKGQS